jgi:hypothetical protein
MWDIQHMAVLIHRPPQIVAFAINSQKHPIHVLLVARPGAPAMELIGIPLPEPPAPLPDRFVGHDNTAGEQQLFDVARAQAEAVIQPDAMTDDLGRKTMVFVWVGWCGGIHRSSKDGLSV